MNTKKTALITGASRGIGLELAALFAKAGNNLVLVARSQNDLEIIQKVFEENSDANVDIIVKDLSEAGAATDVYTEIRNKGIQIDYLVNNAGFGDFAHFAEADWDKLHRMINLNINTLTEFCHLYLRDWMANGIEGKILNIASTAAFQPGPMMAVYFASKTYVLHLSEALRYEVKDHNIGVTVLCPGPTDTNFGKVSNMSASNVVKNVKIASSKKVAQLGYDAMMKNRSVVIEGTVNKIVANAVRFAPREAITNLAGKMMSKATK